MVSSAQPILDVRLQMRLQAPGRAFDLDVAFSSHADRTALLGPSGAGKSLTLAALAGLERPHAGHIRIAGRCLLDTGAGVDLPARDRRIGLVFQDYALFPHLSVQQNIRFGLQGLGRRALPQELEHADALMMQFGLGALAASLPRHLSGGQRQRVALARALAVRPTLLLLDEPFSALDSGLRQRLREDMAALLRDLPVPLVIVSHDEQDVAALAQTIVRIDGGRVI